MNQPSRAAESGPLPRAFVVALAVLGIVLTATVIPGVFIVDDDNYLINVVALRQGHVTVANTAGLTPSRELVFFDPGPELRGVTSTPVASTAPPLYAPIALPFSWFGWRGLVALNTLAYLVTTLLVFRYAQRYATDAATPWLAAAAFALAGFQIEYAQGLWPHELSIVLCTGGIMAVGRLIEGGRVPLAAVAGLMLATATGLRYQNAVLVAVAGAAIGLWSARRWTAMIVYGTAASLPFAVSAAVNHARLGSWNPISKGPGYLRLPTLPGGTSASSLLDPLTMFWARLIDFSVRPPLVGPAFGWVRYDIETGAHLIFGQTPQKAFLQSAPWAVLALLLFALAWIPRFQMPERRRRQLRLLSVFTGAVLATFALSGRDRHEGASYNQRYLLELVPLASVAFAWALEAVRARLQVLGAGLVWGLLAAIVCLAVIPTATLSVLALLKVPIVAAGALGFIWVIGASRSAHQPLATALAGLCLGWAVMIHLGTDVIASRAIKASNRERTEALRAALPDYSAVIAYWGSRDAVGPLLLDRDLVVLDAHADDGRDAPRLIRELLSQGRRVFVMQQGMPPDLLSRLRAGWKTLPKPGRAPLVELQAKEE
jgi:hypothetical protein